MAKDAELIFGVSSESINQIKTDLGTIIGEVERSGATKLRFSVDTSSTSASANSVSKYSKQIVQYYKDIEKQRDAFNNKNLNGIDYEIKKRELAAKQTKAAIQSQMQQEQAEAKLAESNAKKVAAAIKSQTNAHLQYNNILDQAKDYYERYSSSIQKNAQLNAKWQEYLNNMQNAPETYGSQAGARSAMSDLTRMTREAGAQVETLRDRLGRLFGIHVSTMLTMLGIHLLMQSVTQVYQNVVELNDSMTQLQIVTKNTSDQMSEYFESASKSAEKLGVSISDLTTSATTFARLGYSTEQSSALSEYTAMLTKVGDVDTETATNAITAIAKSFNLNVSDISGAMDEMVEIGNNFPISVAQISEGMNNVSSMMATAGNSLEQTMSLLTASNATVQDISKASTGLRTIAARIRNTKTELDGLGESMTSAEYGDLVSALTNAGVKLTDVNGQFRSTYDILKDISSVWKNLTSMQQAGITESLAGTRQANVFSSIVTQFQEAEGAMNAASDSAGKMSDAYNIWLDSISGHLGKIQATFQSLSNNVLDSGLTNFFLTLANDILAGAEALAKWKVLFPAILASVLAIKNAAKPKDGFMKMIVAAVA